MFTFEEIECDLVRLAEAWSPGTAETPETPEGGRGEIEDGEGSGIREGCRKPAVRVWKPLLLSFPTGVVIVW